MDRQNELQLLIASFDLYFDAIKNKNLYRNPNGIQIVKLLISSYYSIVNPDYQSIIFDFRKKYVANEVLVEKNNTLEERRGLSAVYDYIQDFDVDKDYFNIFLCAMIIHEKLYSVLDAQRIDDKKLLEQIIQLESEAKREKDVEKYKKAQELKKQKADSSKFGGKLRNDGVMMKDFNHEVPSARDACIFINSFLSEEKVNEYNKMLNEAGIFEYVDYCVKIIVDLIKNQPFFDGNKRTFRSLLNLMFKKRNIPPVYINAKERDEYKSALKEAIENGNYDRICGFYYYKICDSIYELDIKKRAINMDDNPPNRN